MTAAILLAAMRAEQVSPQLADFLRMVRTVCQALVDSAERAS